MSSERLRFTSGRSEVTNEINRWAIRENMHNLKFNAGLTPEGLPVGLELDGPMGRDRQLLAVAAAVESVLPRMPAPLAWVERA